MSALNVHEVTTILALITSILSLSGSSLLIITILQSKKKLSVPYRRIIFGTSVFDLFQSAGLASQILMAPKGITRWSIGNTTSCEINGFFFAVGGNTIPYYLCSLCIFYFCIIRLNMKTHTFQRIEPFLHALPIIYGFFIGIYALANKYLNYFGASSLCYLSATPPTCEMIPDQECTRGEGAMKFRIFFCDLPAMIIFVIICFIMAVIAYSAYKIEKRNQRYLISSSLSDSEHRSSLRIFSSKLSSTLKTILQINEVHDKNNDDGLEQAPSSTAVSNQTRRKLELDTSRTRETNKQALLYVGSYVLTYGLPVTQSFYVYTTKKDPPIALFYLMNIFLPMQGFINIFIYCRPHIVSLRKRYPDEYTWFQAFKVVLKSGGDSCKVTVDNDRRQRDENKLLIEDD